MEKLEAHFSKHRDEFKCIYKTAKEYLEGYSYKIYGLLKENGKIDAGIILEDELINNFAYLIDKYVELKVDRIDIEFL
jgi:hypothetical protein